MYTDNFFLNTLTSHEPDAIAGITGNSSYPHLYGVANFYQINNGGILIQVEVSGLPDENTPHHFGFYAMHIHRSGNCTPPFDKTGTHYNPYNAEHPNHAGDLPPLFSNNGYAWTVFYNSLLSVKEILDKSIIIHSRRDDFTTNPSGDSGDKIACGSIRPANSYFN